MSLRAGLAGAGSHPDLAFPSPLLPFASLGPLNRVSHGLALRAAQAFFMGSIRAWREEALGLSGRSRPPQPSGSLYAYSPHVVPVPPDWGEDVLVSGYWFLDDPEWQPSEALAAFLAAGAPPVHVGFGSMPGIDPRHMTSLVVEGLARAGRRGLLSRGRGALAAEGLPPHVHLLDGAPYDRLFPLVSATIHHGGAGTTAASLRAGKPCAIVPFFGDQPFWARRVAELGAGPPPLDRKTLSPEALAAAIVAMDAAPMRERARTLGELIGREDGAAAAVHFIEERVQGQAAGGERALPLPSGGRVR